jgi:helicase SWR1
VHRPGTMQLCRFPDKSFLEWDCGKFRFLKSLLKKLFAENHKVVVFTQMSKMLDVIEAFANWCGFTYVRLDGSTKVGDRQLLVDRFNCSKKIFLFISSTRAGGVGINLTSADTVIFFDSDWNPAMDKQAMDRCHRIGQVRDVHVYRLISEKTIEENIFVKQLQKRKLDEVVIDRARTSEEDLGNLESYPVRRENKLVDDLLSGIFSETGLSPEERSKIYGTHVLWEREEVEDVVDKTSSRDLALLAQVEDAEDTIALSSSAKETEKLIEDDEGKEDCEFEKLPGIVKRSVLIVESNLINEAEAARLATNGGGDDSDDWDAIENAEWESEAE